MTSKPNVKTIYIAASCNRASNVSDCRIKDGLLAFGSGCFVALWNSADTTSAGIHCTLPGHRGEITTLKFLPIVGNNSYLVSGDSTGLGIIWKESTSGLWSIYALLEGHTQSISALAALDLSAEQEGNTHIIITGSSDGTLRNWGVSSSGAIQLQLIDLKGKISLDLALSLLPDSQSMLLAIGGTENRIQIYSSPAHGQPKFSKSISLEGHTDWIRSLCFTTPLPISKNNASTSTTIHTTIGYDIEPGEVLLASGSQDNYIRLWRFSRLSSHSPTTTSTGASISSGSDDLDDLERTLAEAGGEEGELRVKAHDFKVENDGEFSCSAEAVLLGHDAWVTGLHWSPSTLSLPLKLLSASADRSMILWAPSSSDSTDSSSIWTSSYRFGEFSSATNLGFFGALWGKNARAVLAHGWGGAWHVWNEEDEGVWEPIVSATGHFGSVKSLAWEPQGEFLISAGSDMTTRLHAPWRRDGVVTWHELGRPQIHGYPIASVAFTDRLQFVSGADEKIVRVFDAPQVFLASLKTLSGIEGLGDEADRPMAANVPPLGLSNRAIANAAEAASIVPDTNDSYDAVLPVNFTITSHPAFEEQLLGSTLWPEIEKLYGHGYEIIALAAGRQTPVIAVACKATSAEHAVIRMYDTKNWKPIGNILEGHALTITSICFSSDDNLLLSVSRDRSWRLYEKVEGERNYKAVANSKSHARIIWDACWTIDDKSFVTASRDKTAKIWTKVSDEWICSNTLRFDEAATALAATRISNPDRHLLAVGLENGHIHLFTSNWTHGKEWTLAHILDSSIAHVLSVTALKFRPEQHGNTITLATASEDKSTKILEIVI